MPGIKARWQRVDESDVLVNCPDYLRAGLHYARVYTAGQGYQYSRTNNLILNLKMGPNEPKERLGFRQQAIGTFAYELAALLKGDHPFVLVPMPPSKTEAHPDHDDRLVQVAEMAASKCSNVATINALRATKDREAYHQGASSRSVDELYRAMELDATLAAQIGAGHREAIIAVVDDVLTSGSSFVAAHKHLVRYRQNRIVGLFWAKAKEAA